MGLCSDFYEELVHKQLQRIKLLEEALLDIKKVMEIKFQSNNRDWSDELQEIDKIVNQIPDLK